MFQNEIIKFLKLKKPRRNQQPKLAAILIHKTRRTCNNACDTGKATFQFVIL